MFIITSFNIYKNVISPIAIKRLEHRTRDEWRCLLEMEKNSFWICLVNFLSFLYHFYCLSNAQICIEPKKNSNLNLFFLKRWFFDEYDAVKSCANQFGKKRRIYNNLIFCSLMMRRIFSSFAQQEFASEEKKSTKLGWWCFVKYAGCCVLGRFLSSLLIEKILLIGTVD